MACTTRKFRVRQRVDGLRREHGAVAENHGGFDVALRDGLKRLRRAEAVVPRRAANVERALACRAGAQRVETARGLPDVARGEGEVDQRVGDGGALVLGDVVQRVDDGGAARLREGPRRRDDALGGDARRVRDGVEGVACERLPQRVDAAAMLGDEGIVPADPRRG